MNRIPFYICDAHDHLAEFKTTTHPILEFEYLDYEKKFELKRETEFFEEKAPYIFVQTSHCTVTFFLEKFRQEHRKYDYVEKVKDDLRNDRCILGITFGDSLSDAAFDHVKDIYEDLDKLAEFFESENLPQKNIFVFGVDNLNKDELKNYKFNYVNFEYGLFYFAEKIMHSTSRYLLERGKVHKRQKHFLFYNCKPRLHRLVSFLELQKNNLLDKGFWSFQTQTMFGTHPDWITKENWNERVPFFDLKSLEEKYGDFSELLDPPNKDEHSSFDSFTRKWYDDNGFDKGNPVAHTINHLPHYNTYFSLVTESAFYCPSSRMKRILNEGMTSSERSDYFNSNPNFNPSAERRYHFFSEKIYKPFLLGHPILFLGQVGALDCLRSDGFETFPEFFDESYDQIEDPLERIYKVTDEVKKLCRLTLEELHTKYYSIEDKLIHNMDHYHHLCMEQRRLPGKVLLKMYKRL
jgi:hypothetical protein